MNSGTTVLVLSTAFLISCLAGGLLVAWLSWTTVRRLRALPEARHRLGLDFLPGWLAVNVAFALARPRRLSRLLEASPLGFVQADSETVHRLTSRRDRLLGRACYVLLMLSIALLMVAWSIQKWGLAAGTTTIMGALALLSLLLTPLPACVSAWDAARVASRAGRTGVR